NTPAAIETAFDRLAAGELEAAAVLLDEAAASDPTSFQWNNLHYLRGRLAEAAEDWNRADAAFAEVSERSVLHPLAVWHRARTAFKTGRVEEGLGLYERLPSGFPQSLRLELARLSPEPARSTMHRGLSGREVDWERASLANDTPAMWRLIERSGADDIALEIAYRLDSARGLT